MSYHKTEYIQDIRNPLLDWLRVSGTGKNVTDKALSLANRAQWNLWAKKPWTNLTSKLEITLVDGEYTFPDNFGRLVEMFADLTGTGTRDYWFYEGCDYGHGYELNDSFTNKSGHSWVITFNYEQQNSVYMRYQRSLEKFTTSDDTQYSFFPANLVILEAQKIRTREKGNEKQYRLAKDGFDEEFKDFSSATQWINYDATPRINDRYGNEIFGSSYSLNGGGSRPHSHYPRGRNF